MPYANNKDADQPAHPRSLISVFVLRFLDNIIPIVATPKISRLLLAYVAEQVVLSLSLSQTPTTGFLVAWLDWHRYLSSSFFSLRAYVIISEAVFGHHNSRKRGLYLYSGANMILYEA